jgi:hypothetical protein
VYAYIYICASARECVCVLGLRGFVYEFYLFHGARIWILFFLVAASYQHHGMPDFDRTTIWKIKKVATTLSGLEREPSADLARDDIAAVRHTPAQDCYIVAGLWHVGSTS